MKARYPEIEALELPRIPDWVASLCVRRTFLGLLNIFKNRGAWRTVTILTFQQALFLVSHGAGPGTVDKG